MKGYEHRLERVKNEFRQAGVVNPLVHVPAVVGKDMTREEKRERCSGIARNFMPASTLGCWFSHYKAWQMAAESDSPMTVILEDDAVFRSTANKATVWEDIKRRVNRCGKFDVFLIGYYGDADPKDPDYSPSALIMRIVQQVANVHPSDHDLANGEAFRPRRFHGAHAYVVTKEAAKKMVDMYKIMDNHVDVVMSNANATDDLRLVASRPSLMRQDESDSSQASKQPHFVSRMLKGYMDPPGRPVDDQRPVEYMIRFPAFCMFGVNVAIWNMTIGALSFAGGLLSPSFAVAFLVGLLAVSSILMIDSASAGQSIDTTGLLVNSLFFGGVAAAIGSLMRCSITTLCEHCKGGQCKPVEEESK